MLFWVIYDISDNNARTKAINICKDYGMFRVQKSAFIGITTKNKAEMMAIEFRRVLGPEDCLFIIPACESCFKHKIIIGKIDEERLKEKEFEIVEAQKHE